MSRRSDSIVRRMNARVGVITFPGSLDDIDAETLRDFVRDEYLPKCRASVGLGALPELCVAFLPSEKELAVLCPGDDPATTPRRSGAWRARGPVGVRRGWTPRCRRSRA